LKYHINTIPLWDAVKKETECPICSIREDLEEKYLDVYLGGAVMEPDVRKQTNEKGFCAKHYKGLYEKQNRLPVGLMTHTRLWSINNDIAPLMDSIYKDSVKKDKKKETLKLNKLIDELSSNYKSCVICDRIKKDLEQYIYTLTYMWSKEREFRDALKLSKGFCIEHFGCVLASARDNMKQKDKTVFIPMVINLQKENLQRMEKEIKWFTDKFDYRNQKEPWGNSHDALPRVIGKLSGRKP